MARPREFDREDVLEKAMLLFWSRGYEATAIRDLTAATGISTSSMYEAFTDKRGIFLAALARYCAVERERIAQMAAESQTPRAFIETLFESVENVSQGRGSFSFNTMVEFGTRDADVTAQLLDHYFKIVDIVADVLAQAQAARTITTKTPPLNLAHTILSTLQGVTTLKGVKPDFSHHHPVMRVVLSLLGECN